MHKGFQKTAKNTMFDNLQLVVIFPRVVLKEKVRNSNAVKKSSLNAKETTLEGLSKKEVSRKTVVHLIYSDSVARGHIMLPLSLRYYLRADLHSCLTVLLSPSTGKLFSSYKLPLPGHVLISGPPSVTLGDEEARKRKVKRQFLRGRGLLHLHVLSR